MYKSEVVGKGSIRARVVEDSVSNGTRLTTLELNYPRFIHSEFMTHRLFSRNASSSRAIPVHRMLKQVKHDPAMPIHWGKNQKGMQAREEHDAPITRGLVSMKKENYWEHIAGVVSFFSEKFMEAGYHKQIVNRLTEPFQFINVVVTATEWDNFFALRLHEDAQPEIYELARVMHESMEKSSPRPLEKDEWHMPYVTSKDWEELEGQLLDLLMVSIARCARVSYKNHDKSDPNTEKDIKLADMLLEAGHMSPFEHQATPMTEFDWERGITHKDRKGQSWSNNFKNWIQYRALISQ